MAPRFVAKEGGVEMQALELRAGQERWVVGRSLESDLCVDHPSLSRRHCAITRTADGSFFIADLGSVHGTRYAGEALAPDQPMRLFDGVIITLGHSAREYTTMDVPLIPVSPTGAPGGAVDNAAAARVVKGAARRPEGATAEATVGVEGAADAEMQEMLGLPLAFGRAANASGAGAAGAPSKGPHPKEPRKGQHGKIVLGARLGATLGVAPDAPKAAPPAAPPTSAVAATGAADAATGAPPSPARAPIGASMAADGAADDGDDDLIGPPMPVGLAASGASGAESDDELIGPPLPTALRARAEGDGSHDDDDDDDDDEGAAEEAAMLDRFRRRLPTSHCVPIRGHGKTVRVVALDGAGARMLTGSLDGGVRLYDFNGMAQDMRPFRTLEEPLGSYQIRSADWSPTSSNLILGGSSAQPRLLDRDGKALSTLMRGDMYLRDLTHTKGHIAAVTCVRWHPAEPLLIATAGEDSTVRIWDVEVAAGRDDRTSLSNKSGQLRALALKDARGQRTAVSSIDWQHDGRSIALATVDGCVQLWDTRHHDTRPQLVATGAHVSGTSTACVRFAPAAAGSGGTHTLASRGGLGDETLCVWDLRVVRAAAQSATLGGGRSAACEPVHRWSGLRTLPCGADCVWSPSGTMVATGTAFDREAAGAESGEDGSVDGCVVAFSLDEPRAPPLRERVGERVSVSGLAWHARLNQLFAGGSDGAVLGFYSEGMSERGLLYCAHRAVRRRDVELGDIAALHAANAIAPAALGARRPKKRGREREREREVERHQPMRPPPGVGSGGRLADNLTHALIKTVDKGLNSFRDEDPREALLKFAELTEKDPLWTSAYAKTQPKPILAKTVDPQDEEQ